MRVEPFTPEHDQLRDTVRRWVTTEVTPHGQEWEDADGFPDTIIRRAGELGFLGLSVDPAYGGSGADYWATVVLGEELGRSGLGGLPMALSVQTDMATPPIAKFGTHEQKQRYLAPAVAGQKIAAIGISEPDAGSDVAGVRTRAVRDGDGWVINGAKTYITNGTRADFVTMVVRTSGQPGEHAGLSLMLVDTDLPGFSVARKLDKLGMRSSDTAELSLVDVHVGSDALLGEEDRGFEHIMWQLQGERLISGFQAIGTSEALLARAVAYAREREAFGRPIGTFQVQRHRLAEIATRVEATKRMVYVAAQAWDDGHYPTLLVAQCKLATARLAWWVADEVMQLFGGFGYAEESGIPRLWRDMRLLRIGGGADEVQLEIIAKLLDGTPVTSRGAAGTAPLPRLGAVQAGGRRDIQRFARPGAAGDPSGVRGLDPIWNEAHEALRATARAFVAAEITPHVEEWEAARDFPRELFAKVGAAGFFGLKFEEAHGGSGPDFAAQAVWVEELARCGAGGLAADLGAHSDLATLYVARAGDGAQKQRWVTPSVAGEVIGALAITEPDAGSDVAGMRTRAVRDGGGWVLNGAKTYITNGSWADYMVVAAKTDPGLRSKGRGHADITLFVVEADTQGVDRRRLSMLGWHTSHTGELSFADVRVPDGHRIGEEGAGFYTIMQNFAWERLSLALGAVIAAETALEGAMGYGRQREAFGRPIGTFQTWQHTFAELATEIAQGRALTEHALRVMLAGTQHAAVEAAKAKLFTQRLAFKAADAAVQIHGGAGYMRSYPAQRWLRDSRLGPIGGGTDEIMKEIIGRAMGF
ncbi:MAG TPA: acyl-CoA dehydrogenase family protein [Euzebya sp.]|nr:acyl-CoA dehydrogenase family protein [Euzebya sp.]